MKRQICWVDSILFKDGVIQSADPEISTSYGTNFYNGSPLAQYAAFSSEERKLHVVIDNAIDYLHPIEGEKL